MFRAVALFRASIVAVLCGAGSAQSVKLNDPLPFGPVSNGGRVLDASIGAGRVVYRADQAARDVIELFTVPLDGSQPAQPLNAPLPPDGDVLSFQLTADGTRVLYLADQHVESDHRYFSVPSDGSAAPVELSGSLDPAALARAPRITADGSRLVYVGWGGSTLFIVPMDGSTVPEVLAGSVDSFTLAPDGSRAIFVERGPDVAHLRSVRLDRTQAPLDLSIAQQAEITDYRVTGDGARVVYVAWGTQGSTSGARELFSVPTDGSAGRVRLSAPLVGTRNVEEFLIAPGDARVVYLCDETDEHLELFSAPVDGSQARVRISGNMPASGDVTRGYAFAIAPDGRTVVFRADLEQNEAFRLYRTPIAGLRPPERVVDLDANAFALDPAGLRVVFQHPLPGGARDELMSVPLHRLPPAMDLGGNPQVVEPVRLNGELGASGSVYGFTISPDARSVVYHASQDSQQIELYRAPIAGGAAPVKLNAPFVAGGNLDGLVEPLYQISPDASRVVYQADQEQDQLFELFSVPLDGSLAPAKLNGALDPGPIAGDVGMVLLTPDGTRYVYFADGDVDGVWCLYGGPLDGTSPPAMLAGSPSTDRGIHNRWSFTPDGTRTVFTSNQNIQSVMELYSVPTDGSSPPVKLNHNLFLGGSVEGYSVSPTSDRVVYEYSYGLYSVPVQGGSAPVKISANVRAAPSFPSTRFWDFAPDGSRVLFQSPWYDPQPGMLYGVPSDGSQLPVRVSALLTDPRDVMGFALAPRGERVVYFADQELDERFELYSVPSAASAEPAKLSRLVTGGSVRALKVAAHGERAVYLADAEVAGVVELFSASLHPPARSSNGTVRPRRVKLNGPLPSGADVALFELDPQGRQVAFTVQTSSLDARLFAVPIDRSSPAQALSGAADAVQSFQFSPDGTRVVFVAHEALSGATQIYSAPADGSAPAVQLNGALVADGNVHDLGHRYRYLSFAISPDSRWVAYLADQQEDERFELFLRAIDGAGGVVKLNDPLVAGGDVGLYDFQSPQFLFSADNRSIVYLADQDTDGVVELFRRSRP